jgi:DNA-binding protein HU-beta
VQSGPQIEGHLSNKQTHNAAALGASIAFQQRNNFLLSANHFLLSKSRLLEYGRKSMANIATNPRAAGSITLKDLAASLAVEHHLTKRAGQELLNDLIVQITRHLKRGERVRIAHLGILQVKKRAARMGRNPTTGEPIKIGASRRVAFRPTKELKFAA